MAGKGLRKAAGGAAHGFGDGLRRIAGGKDFDLLGDGKTIADDFIDGVAEVVGKMHAGDEEQEFEFGVVRQLFEGPLAHADAAERESLYQGAAELASPLFGPSAGDGRSAPDLSFTLVHGLYWLTANLAETGPVMIAVDDVLG